MSTSYEFQFCGDCLGSMVESGTSLEVEADSEIRPGDLVALFLQAAESGPYSAFINAIGQGGYVGVCKIFLGSAKVAGEEIALMGTLNPPGVHPVPIEHIEAMHKVVDRHHTGSPPEVDMRAVRLIWPFSQPGSRASINPAWQPQEVPI